MSRRSDVSVFHVAMSALPLVALLACGERRSLADTPAAPPAADAAAPAAPTGEAPPPAVHQDERHFGALRQLTFGGENAEAYWAFGGGRLILQATTGDSGCDRIYTLDTTAAQPTPRPVSSGLGVTTCAYFLPGDEEVIYASTHLAGPACPPKPDRSMGYVWALYEGYDIFKSKVDGSALVRLTDAPGYDAEATVCERDGSILFTSTRDGDIDLYRMDRDGQNVKRLTDTPGYDGGAFFSRDCSQIVWRASRPRPGKELEEFRALLGKHLVRPSKLELYVANADGSEARQITWLGAASFAPYFYPSGTRVIFSSNHGDPKGREFDLWAVDTDGTDLERITFTPGFDGFPMFSPDGSELAFASNRATAPGRSDTNVFVTRWVEGAPIKGEGAPDRIMDDVAWLADPAREGRGLGLPGLAAAGRYLAERFLALGLAPLAGTSFEQPFSAVTGLEREDGTRLVLDGRDVPAGDFAVLGYSPLEAEAEGAIVAVGYGIVAPELGVDDYAGHDVKGKVALVRRFVPDVPALKRPEVERRYGDLRFKAWLARERGAVALLVVDDPLEPPDAPVDWKAPAEAALPELSAEGYSDAGLPVVVLRRAALGKARRATIEVRLKAVTTEAFNVVARLEAAPADGKKLPGVVVIGAHYDHLGLGQRGSLAPDRKVPHLGADDNASGTAVLLEVARSLADKRGALRRDVVFVAFSGEEAGLLGSAAFVRAWPDRSGHQVGGIVAMVNMDMVGRMRGALLQILGTGTASEWPALIAATCEALRLQCGSNEDGYGPSDQTSFYAAGVPVLHLFTGAHGDYHKPSDSADRINAGGAAAVARFAEAVVRAVADGAPLTLQNAPAGPTTRGDRRSFNASLGTIPNYAGPGEGKKGVLLDGVRPGGAAEKAGMRRGDVLIELGTSEIASVEDLMFVLNARKPGETVLAKVLRDGEALTLEVTFQESARPR